MSPPPYAELHPVERLCWCASRARRVASERKRAGRPYRAAAALSERFWRRAQAAACVENNPPTQPPGGAYHQHDVLYFRPRGGPAGCATNPRVATRTAEVAGIDAGSGR